MGFQQFEDENLEERLDESIMASISGDIALYAGKLSPAQTEYIRAVVKGVAAHQNELDETITANTRSSVMSPHDGGGAAPCHLRDALCGGCAGRRFAINEAVELAKVYDTDEAAAFINGVLGSVARATKPECSPGSDAAAAPTENADA